MTAEQELCVRVRTGRGPAGREEAEAQGSLATRPGSHSWHAVAPEFQSTASQSFKKLQTLSSLPAEPLEQQVARGRHFFLLGSHAPIQPSSVSHDLRVCFNTLTHSTSLTHGGTLWLTDEIGRAHV